MPDVPNAQLWSFAGQLAILPAVTMLFATSVRTEATAAPSDRDTRHMRKLTPHGCVVVAWVYTMAGPLLAAVSIAWATVLALLCAACAVPLFFTFATKRSRAYGARRTTMVISGLVWFVWTLCVHAPRALGIMDQEQEFEWYQCARALLRMIPPSYRASPTMLYRPTTFLNKFVVGESVRWRDRAAEKLTVRRPNSFFFNGAHIASRACVAS